MRRRKRLINQARSPSPLAGSFPVEGREASHFYGKEGPALWPGGVLADPVEAPTAGLGEASGCCAASHPAPSPKPARVHVLPCPCEPWHPWGHRLCRPLRDPPGGGMAVLGLAGGSAPGAGGHWGQERG